MDPNERKNVLVTCGPGLSSYLEAELGVQGFKVQSTNPGGVVIKASFNECIKLNFVIRTAYNVLYLLKEFGCGSAESLYKQVGTIPWEKMIDPSEYVSVVSTVDTWSIDNSMYPNLKVKDAIVDRINRKTGKRPDAGADRDNVVVNLYWKNDKAWLYLNTSGQKISDRNYRKMPYKAPLRECLAAGLLMAAGYGGSQDLVLPMCGSGTLAIEAAFIAMNKPAAIHRSNFGFKHIKVFDEQKWQQVRDEFTKNTKKDLNGKRIIATDIHPEAIKAAKQNAKTAGVEHLIEFGVCDFAETEIPATEGIVLMNPEYGLRLGDTSQLEAMYKRIGDFFKQKCAGCTGYVFTGNRNLAGKIGLRAARRMEFFNGNIECRLMKYELYSGTKHKDFSD